MDRRSFLRTSAIGAAGATALAAPAIAQGQRTLTMVTTWPRGLAGVHDSVTRVADSIGALSDGQLTIDVKAAGELVGAFEVFDAVTSGQADMYHGADYYFVGQHPAYGFFTTVPFGMTSQELVNWYFHGGGMELHDELGQIFGLKATIGGNTGPQPGGFFNKQILTAEDFQGLKVRMPGLGGQVVSKMGASVQNIPAGEIYQALSSGAIDATEWVGPWSDQALGLQEITKFYYTAGFHEPGSALSVAVNREVFDSLTPAQQQIIMIASQETHQWNLAQFLANNGRALQQLQAGGVQALEFPDTVWDAAYTASQAVHEENMGDEIYKRVYDSYMTSMRDSNAWTAVSYDPYTRQRNRVMGI